MENKKAKIKTCTLPVVGMGCAGCAVRVDKTLHEVEGVREAGVNFAAQTARISFDEEQCSIERLKAAVRAAGYDLLTDDSDQAAAKAKELRKQHYEQLKRSCLGAWILAVVIMVGSMFFVHIAWVPYAVWIASTISLFVFGREFFINAWRQLLHLSFNMDSLVATSTGIAYLFSVFNLFFPKFWEAHGIESHLYFETASGLIAFILLGRTLEERAKQRTSVAIERLIGLKPKRVTIVDDEGERKIPVSRIERGHIVVVHPGERIAVDGTVVEGESYVDESMLSGEPVAVFKHAGEKVFSGTSNRDGSFRFRAEKVGNETVLAQIIRMVEQAQGSRAPIQNVVDKVAGIFAPAIIAIAVIAFCAWYFLAPESGFEHGLLTMMTVLVIACPCALGLATPTAIMVGIGRGAEAGILIKDAESLQTARQIDTVVLDKTGTLTEGRPEVADALWAEESAELKGILAGLERRSNHPLAEAVAESLKDAQEPQIDHFINVAGEGVRGKVAGRAYYVGNGSSLIKQGMKIEPKFEAQAEAWLKEAHTLVWFADEERVVALLALNDRIKSSSKEAVDQLREMGIEVCLLTGDHEASAQVAARKTGITQVKAGVLPQDKAAYIKQLQADGKRVAMVGDGINDSAALATADLSIAMGQGSDIAVDSAQVTILASDLRKISEMIRLSRATMRTLNQNLFWAFIYNTISVPIAAGILYPVCGFLLHPMIGGAAMAFSSLSVVTNSLRLKRVKLTK